MSSPSCAKGMGFRNQRCALRAKMIFVGPKHNAPSPSMAAGRMLASEPIVRQEDDDPL